MTEHISLLAENFNNIKECFLHDKNHTFCDDCLERKSFDDDPCQLCRPFYSIPDSGYAGYSREYLLEKLAGLHKSCVENISGVEETTLFDIPLVEKFILGPVSEDFYESKLVAWLDSKIYVSYRFGIRVFTDQAPFTELPEQICILQLVLPTAMVASTSTNSLLLNDSIFCCIWKIQLPERRICRIGLSYVAGHLSITPDDALLVVVGEYSFDILSLNDFSRKNSIAVPFNCTSIPCAVQLPNTNIIFAYNTDQFPIDIFGICLMTSEGNALVKFDPSAFEPNHRYSWCPQNLVIGDAGQVFISDAKYGRLYVFNSKLTDLQVSNLDFDSPQGPTLHYAKGRQQLLVRDESDDGIMSLSVLHLSPCNLIRGRNDRVIMPASNLVYRIRRKRKAYKFSTWNFQKLGMKRRRY